MLSTSNALASRSSASLHPRNHAACGYPRCVQRAVRLVPCAWPGGSKNQGYQQEPARGQGSMYPQVPTYTPSEPSAPPMSDYRSSAYAQAPSGGLSEADELDLQRLRGSSGAYSPEPGIVREVLSVNDSLLDAIAANDYSTYKGMCDEGLTCFEPETNGHLVEGLEFHKFYFSDTSSSRPKVLNTILGPKVHLLAGGAAAVVSYTRLVQKFVNGSAITTAAAETRVWEKKNGKWVHVHFHKSTSA